MTTANPIEINIVKTTGKLCFTQTVSLTQSNLGFHKLSNSHKKSINNVNKIGTAKTSKLSITPIPVT